MSSFIKFLINLENSWIIEIRSSPPYVVSTNPSPLSINFNSSTEAEISAKLNYPISTERFIPFNLKFPANIRITTLAHLLIRNRELYILFRAVAIILGSFSNLIFQIICENFSQTFSFSIYKDTFNIYDNISFFGFLSSCNCFLKVFFTQYLEFIIASSETDISGSITASFTTIN